MIKGNTFKKKNSNFSLVIKVALILIVVYLIYYFSSTNQHQEDTLSSRVTFTEKKNIKATDLRHTSIVNLQQEIESLNSILKQNTEEHTKQLTTLKNALSLLIQGNEKAAYDKLNNDQHHSGIANKDNDALNELVQPTTESNKPIIPKIEPVIVTQPAPVVNANAQPKLTPPTTAVKLSEIKVEPTSDFKEKRAVAMPTKQQLIAYPSGILRPQPMPKLKDVEPGYENPKVIVYVVGGWPLGVTYIEQECVVPCVWSVNAQFEAKADALFWEGMRMGSKRQYLNPKPANKPNQKRVLFSMESDYYYAHQKDKNVMGKMDVSMTYRLDNFWPHLKHLDFVPGPYFSNIEYSHFMKARPGMWKKTGFVLWAHNNCAAISRRHLVVQKLMDKGLKVDSFGRCLHNKDNPGAKQSKLVNLLATYKFYLMFENVFDDYDWVSSTYFRAIDAGAVPVYMGAPNIDKFAPSKYSIIKANEFDTTEDLITYLNFLNENDDEYYKYLQWKKDGPSEDFRKLMSIADIHSRCRLCMFIANEQREKYSPTIQKILADNEQYRQEYFALNERLNKEANHTMSYVAKTEQWINEP